MKQIYAMQRANGDWFALDNQGSFGVPLFRSSRDAMVARSRNWGMRLFKPVALTAHSLKELVPVGDASDVEFWLVDDPLVSLSRGRRMEHAELALLIGDPLEIRTATHIRNSPETPRPRTDTSASETWEDEGGLSSRVA